MNVPIIRTTNWKLPFQCHTVVSQLTIGRTLTQIDGTRKYTVSYFSKRLSPAEKNYSASEREILALINLLQHFRCDLEGSSFEVLTDNEVLRIFSTKSMLSRREARWLDFLGGFVVSATTLLKEKIHVLGDALSRAPHVITSNTSIDARTHTISVVARPI